MIAKYGKLNDSIGAQGMKARDMELVRGIKVLDTLEKRDIVDCRLYMGRSSTASTVYCNIWVYGDSVYASASGKAGGYGYDKKSAAVSSALDNLGVELYHDDGVKKYSIAGVGDEAVKEALLAVVVALGYSADNLLYVECFA